MQIWNSFTEKLNYLDKDPLYYCKDVENEVSLVQRVFDSSFGNENANIQETLRYNRKRINQTKKRWVKSAIKDYKSPSSKKPKELLAEYEFFKDYFSKFGAPSLKDTYQKETPEEIISDRIEELKKWSEDKNSLLSNYRYIRSKTKTQIEKIIFDDLLILIGDTIMKKYDGKVQNMIIEEPSTFVDYPIFSNNRGKLQLSNEEIKEDEGDYYYNDYAPSNKYTLRTLVPKMYADGKNLVGILDDTDREIFSQVMKQRSGIFATQRRIFVSIGQIVKNSFKSDGIENYKLVESRIYKMFNMRFKIQRTENSIGFGIFDYVNIDYENGWTAEITINDTIHQEYLKKQTIRMYKDVLKNLELPISKSLIFILQKERFLCHSEQQSYVQEYPYSFFTHKLRFKSRSKGENFKILAAALDEIKHHKVAVKDFKFNGDTIQIEYIEVTQYEIEDLIHSSWQIEQDFNPSSFLETSI